MQSFLLTVALASSAALAASPITVRVSDHIRYQTYDGTGISEAFQRSLVLHQLDPPTQNAALDLLFTEKGAGMTILRNGLGSSPTDPFDLMKSICPVAPASNSSELNFIPLPREDEYQVWLSHQAIARGVHTVYADAWSADGYMKTNGTDDYGGYLCGVTNTSCATGDWRQSYANKIVRYIQDYARNGIKIDYVGFLNEPDQNTAYASMLSNGRQAADFIKVLRPALDSTGLKTQIACCDGSGWEQNRERLTGIQAAGEEQSRGLVTAHGYSSAPGTPYNTPLKTWITEWSTFDAANLDWYNSSTTGSYGQSFGLTWANHIQEAFAHSNVSAFLYWWGAANATDNESLLIVNGTSELRVTKRLYAMAHWGSKFVRKGAVRIDAAVSAGAGAGGGVAAAPALNATALRNTDGSVAVQIINNSDAPQPVSVVGFADDCREVETFLTNQQYDLKQGSAENTRGAAQATVPARSLLSFVGR